MGVSELERALGLAGLGIPRAMCVGYSGGKDSGSLCLLLRDVGVEVVPIIVDLGYQSFRSTDIAREIARHGFKPEVLNATHDSGLIGLTRTKVLDVRANLVALADPTLEIPCTLCSQTKRTLLASFAERHDVPYLALGHHREDFVATLLKDYFANKYSALGVAYDDASFHSFVVRTKVNLDEIRAMVSVGDASTMSLRMRLSPKVEMVRPLALIPEEATRSIARQRGLRTFGSGCSHGVMSGLNAKLSKREIVHQALTELLTVDAGIGSQLLEIVLTALDANGRTRYSPRQSRRERLGF